MKGQTALITGGGRGIGEAAARALARAGARVFIASRTRSELERVAAETGAEFAVCDVTLPSDVEALARRVGPVQVLVNNAGVAESAPLARMDLEFWRKVMDTNLTSAFLLARSVVPAMVAARYGRIVNVASIAGKRGGAYISAYAASKHGLLGLTSSLAMELAGHGVLVNAVCPGYVDTPMTRRNVERIAQATGKPPDQVLRSFLDSMGQSRLLEPEVVAKAILELAAPECAHTGAAIDLL